MRILKLLRDIILIIIMLPMVLIGAASIILIGMVHFTKWYIKRLKTKI
jgi:hypothetical protein